MKRVTLICACLMSPALACGEGAGDTGASTETSEPTGDGDATGDGDGDGDGDPTGDGDGDGDPPDECAVAADCTVVNDCCSCGAAPVNMVPICEENECFAPQCDANFGPPYVPEATCNLGGCALVPVSCRLSDVECDAAQPPACEGGTIRSVIDGCYGPCVLPSMCISLSGGLGCDSVDCGEGYGCMETQSGSSNACVFLPPACGDDPDCACVDNLNGYACGGACSGGSNGKFVCEDGG